MKKTPRKIFAFLLILFIISSSFTKRAAADMLTGTFDSGTGNLSSNIDIGSLSKEAFNSILGDMGMNKASLKSSVNAFNVTQRKIPAPAVAVSFSPANPVEGEKVTATAMVTNVMNDANQVYYTWYLKNKKCTDEEVDGDKYHYDPSCDEDGDGHVNIEDYKIKAARIIAGNDFNWQDADYSHESTGDSGYKAPSGGGDQVGKKGSVCYVHDFRNGLDWPFANCFHLFPNTTHHSDLNDNDNKISDSGEVIDKPSGADMLGDGVFGASEEKFWHTNPYAKDTLGSGNTDEANALGLGQKDFTFTYTNGDKLGVVAEAISTQPTTSSGPSTAGLNPAFRTEWAFLDNSCDFDPCKKSDLQCPGLHDDQPNCSGGNAIARECISDDTATAMGDDKDFTTANDYSPRGVAIKNINKDCVAKHFIDPLTGGGATEKLDVNLTYSPQNPVNDNSGDNNGDEVILSADVSNATDSSNYVNYSWKVLMGSDISSENWTALDPTKDLDGVTKTSGLNMKDFKFKMNFSTDTLGSNKYLKVQVTAKEELGLDHQREGHSDVIIPINTSNDRLSVYSANVTFDGTTPGTPPAPDAPPSLHLPDNFADHERCLDKDTKPKGICEVAKDEIIAVAINNKTTGGNNKYSDFNWTIDGKPFECIGGKNFEGCSDIADSPDGNTETYINYIPITQPVGTIFSVNLTGNNQSAADPSDAKFSLTRVFQVTDPDVTLACGKDDHNCEALLLGKYTDLKDTTYEDRSETSFKALTGDVNITLTPTFSDVFSLKDANKFEWTVDGKLLSLENVTDYGYGIGDHNELMLTPKEYGDSYSVIFSGLYVPSTDVRKALNHWWGVSYNDFYEKSITKTVRIEMVDSLPSTVAMAKPGVSTPKKVFATVASGIPDYFVFLFRIFLSGAVIIIALKIIFFVILKQEKHEL